MFEAQEQVPVGCPTAQAVMECVHTVRTQPLPNKLLDDLPGKRYLQPSSLRPSTRSGHKAMCLPPTSRAVLRTARADNRIESVWVRSLGLSREMSTRSSSTESWETIGRER